MTRRIGLMGFNDRWLADWLDHNEEEAEKAAGGQGGGRGGDGDGRYIGVYVGGTALFLFFLLVSSATVQVSCARANIGRSSVISDACLGRYGAGGLCASRPLAPRGLCRQPAARAGALLRLDAERQAHLPL